MQQALNYLIIPIIYIFCDSDGSNLPLSFCKDTIPQYFLLKEKLKALEQLEMNTPFEKIDFQTKDSVQLFSAVKHTLVQLGYSPFWEQVDSVSHGIRKMIMEFQKDHGLKEDGVIGKEFKTTINIPIVERINKLKKNMERAAKMPPMEVDQVMINIPTFEMKVFDHDTLVLESDVIVGRRKTKTASITGKFEYVVFNPYWNIPNSILKKEIMPELNRSSDYLIHNDMEWVGERLRQRPGPQNALGKIKFIFPNPYNMYLHDTPNKNLFMMQKRMFSHGCIRIAKPIEFATYLLGKETPKWTQEDIINKIEQNKELFIKLNKRVNIMIYYMTAFVGENGRLNYRNDIYGLD